MIDYSVVCISKNMTRGGIAPCIVVSILILAKQWMAVFALENASH